MEKNISRDGETLIEGLMHLSIPALEQAVIEQLSAIADDASNPSNDVRVALGGYSFARCSDGSATMANRQSYRPIR
jgi:hypothetical protein